MLIGLKHFTQQAIAKILSFEISHRIYAIILIVAIITIVVDSTIVKYSAFGYYELPEQTNMMIFISFVTIFVVCNWVLLRSLKGVFPQRDNGQRLNLNYPYVIISIVQCSITVIMISLILQIVSNNSYDIHLLYFIIYAVYVVSMGLSSCLTFMFLRWFISNKQYTVLLYATSFFLITIYLVLSLLYLTIQFSSTPAQITPIPIHQSMTTIQTYQFNGFLNNSLDLFSILSFVAIWLTTASLLRQYSFRIGRVKYWLIISAPLIYFLFPLEKYIGNVFFMFMYSSPILFGIVYVLFFSATKQVGGILFGLVFWTASRKTRGKRLQESLLISAAGMIILFGSAQIDSLLYGAYPPYGLVTISFMPLGSYLLFIGIFTSARTLSQDGQLRKEFYKSAESHLALLKTIGVTEMERLLEKNSTSLS